MTKSVITLRETDTITEAIQSLKSHHITGAPVVDENGTLVGLLSISDLCDWPLEASQGGSGQSFALPVRGTQTGGALLAHGEGPTTWDLFDRAVSFTPDEAEQSVQSRMSTSVTSVTVDAPLVEVARVMCDGHWHRVPVVDDDDALQGIVSTMDVLAAVVNAADEAER